MKLWSLMYSVLCYSLTTIHLQQNSLILSDSAEYRSSRLTGIRGSNGDLLVGEFSRQLIAIILLSKGPTNKQAHKTWH